MSIYFLLNLNFRSLLCYKIFDLHGFGNINKVNECEWDFLNEWKFVAFAIKYTISIIFNHELYCEVVKTIKKVFFKFFWNYLFEIPLQS